ncbi:hypothetical protein KFK09_012219 [Dendrobium nobile]|uniref:Uncharacterized protein n=1 Tax=Dendrobium nobile TaxID=94219 RepID=A0A8T3BEQ1_DENNO|nr:hypothetical protein KFK09_012219 [Dendrobium nobile]
MSWGVQSGLRMEMDRRDQLHVREEASVECKVRSILGSVELEQVRRLEFRTCLEGSRWSTEIGKRTSTAKGLVASGVQGFRKESRASIAFILIV